MLTEMELPSPFSSRDLTLTRVIFLSPEDLPPAPTLPPLLWYLKSKFPLFRGKGIFLLLLACSSPFPILFRVMQSSLRLSVEEGRPSPCAKANRSSFSSLSRAPNLPLHSPFLKHPLSLVSSFLCLRPPEGIDGLRLWH